MRAQFQSNISQCSRKGSCKLKLFKLYIDSLSEEVIMARCFCCNEKIRTGDSFVLEGQYPGFTHKLFFAPLSGLDYFGPVYHTTCFFEMLRPRTPQPETIIREGEITKRCPQCGTEFSEDFKFCPYCGGFAHAQ